MRSLILVALLASAAFADPFEAKKITRVEDIVWAVTATCSEHGNDTEQRQCKQLRDARVKELAKETWLVEARTGGEGDATAFTVGAYDAAKKSAPLTLASCVSIGCSAGGVTVEGKSYQVFGGAPKLEGGKVVPPLLHDSAQPFADVKAYEAFKAKVATARVDLLITVAGKRQWSVGGKSGLLVDVAGYRVVEPCTGDVVIAKPASPAVAPDKKACAKK